MTGNTRPVRRMNALERNLIGMPAAGIPRLLPGLAAVGLLSWISVWLSEFAGVTLLGFDKTPISAAMLAILLGLIASTIAPMPRALEPGIQFAVKKLLRLGIILLGIRLTIFDVFKLGLYGVPIVALCVLGALLFTTYSNRRLNLPARLGTLIAVGTSICGVSAIVATGPAIEAEDEEVAYAVAVITLFGLAATIVYPYLANLLFAGDPVNAGLFLGTAVHDTSQVVGAGKVYADVFAAPRALDVATVTKLVRNVLMALVIPFMAFSHSRRRQDRAVSGDARTRFLSLLPLFVVGFLLVAALRSAGDAGINAGGMAFGLWDSSTWQGMHNMVKNVAENLMVVALAGVGLGTNFRSFKGLGIKPFIVGLVAALAVGVLSYVAISLLGRFVTI
ncbi:MAG TPA: putative sulfate exporter family transporter [Anaerolineae bacterium]|nr:putative sulfate exporter family transporter [Anaerolineae bacterium]